MGLRGPPFLSRILGHRQLWDEACLAGFFAKALPEAVDTVFVLVDLEPVDHLQSTSQSLLVCWASLVAQSVKNLPAVQETPV